MVLSPKSSKFIYRNTNVGSSQVAAAQFVPCKSLGGDTGALCWQNTARLYFMNTSQVRSADVDAVCQLLWRWRFVICRTHTPVNGHLSWTTQVSLYQKGKTNLDLTEARDSEWQWHQLDHMQVCTSHRLCHVVTPGPLVHINALHAGDANPIAACTTTSV